MNLLVRLSVCLLASGAVAQDFLLYKFDDGCANEAINFASGAAAWRGNGLLECNPAGVPLTTGRFRQALAGGNPAAQQWNRVRTGWNPSVQPLVGSMTLAFWMRERTRVTAVSYICGTTALGGTRLFTGGAAGRGLYQLAVVTSGGNGAAQSDVVLPPTIVDVQARAAAGWTHVALVIDAQAATAQWFVDGRSMLLLRNVGSARIATNGEFLVGFQGSTNASSYDLDEFLLSRRAYAGSEILALAAAPRAGDGVYASGVAQQCGTASLRSYGGAPAVGNGGYGLEIDSPASGTFFLVLGYERCSLYGVVPLPYLLSLPTPGCWLMSDVESVHGGSIAGAPVRVPLGIPPAVAFLDLRAFAQCAVVDGAGMHFTHGLAISVGL